MEVELNFRLDSDGRTADTRVAQGSNDTHSTSEPSSPKVDYQPKTTLTNLAKTSNGHRRSDHDDVVHDQWLDDLLLDAEITDCGLMPRTFWMPADGTAARCTLEQFALDVFHHHVPSSMIFDPSQSGAEWWVQIRPSPEGTGRYSMHDDSPPDDIAKTGISFHWDKDEDLRLLTGGNTYIHPHLSTVTYLTDYGCPTLALNCRIHCLTGEWILPPHDNVQGFVSWPRRGKHMSFDGRFLHAALPDMMEEGSFEKQCHFAPTNDTKQDKILKRRHRRTTFLVNIWLNYRPFEVKEFPETMIDKLSGHADKDRKHLIFQKTGSNDETVRSVFVNGDKATACGPSLTETKLFTWPLGDCDSNESLTAKMPLNTIQKEATSGGDVRIQWSMQDLDIVNCNFKMRKGPPPEGVNKESLEVGEKRLVESDSGAGSAKRHCS